MDALAEVRAAAAADPMVPRIVRVAKRTRELPGHVTLELEPEDDGRCRATSLASSP